MFSRAAMINNLPVNRDISSYDTNIVIWIRYRDISIVIFYITDMLYRDKFVKSLSLLFLLKLINNP